MGEKKLAPGRPPKLDDALATQIAALLLAGQSTTDVAQMLGVSRRSIAGWRARAWSRDPHDRQCVELEQMLVRGLIARAEFGPRARVLNDAELQSLDELLAELHVGD